MGWNNLNYAWRGVIIGGVTALLSVFALMAYIIFFFAEVVTLAVLLPIAIFTLLKLVWGAIIGYFAGAMFLGKKKKKK